MKHEHTRYPAGFTLIELLIVISVICLVAGMGFVSLRDFSDRQIVSNSARNFTAALQSARSRALSQVKPTSCGTDPLDGYRVSLTCKDSLCASYTGYSVSPVCGPDAKEPIATSSFPGEVGVTTDTSALVFETLTGLVARPDASPTSTEIKFTGKTKNETITVYHDGRIVQQGAL